jgi:hypothetical protein
MELMLHPLSEVLGPGSVASAATAVTPALVTASTAAFVAAALSASAATIAAAGGLTTLAGNFAVLFFVHSSEAAFALSAATATATAALVAPAALSAATASIRLVQLSEHGLLSPLGW